MEIVLARGDVAIDGDLDVDLGAQKSGHFNIQKSSGEREKSL